MQFKKTIVESKAVDSTNPFNWKFHAIKQIGLVISKQYKNMKDCFEKYSQGMGKITFAQFKTFLDESHGLVGLNLTGQLVQQLYSEIDPHKKGFLTEEDWTQAFSK
jgi:Ca2+-binding EF-hand superfamily protein